MSVHRPSTLAAAVGLALAASLAAAPTAATAAVAAVQARVVSSMSQVRPDQPVPPSTTGATLVAARGEYESFQVVVTGPATGVRVSGDLFGWGTTRLSREDYVTVTQRSDTEGATGRWADRLVPDVDQVYGERRNAFPLSVPAGQNRAVWVDVFVPLGTPATTYTGSLSVKATDLTSTRVPVQLRVLPFDLPATSSLTNVFDETIDAGVDPVCRAHTGTNGCSSPAQRAELHSMYARVALENRITLQGLGIPYDSAPNWYPGATWEQTLESPLITATSTYPATAQFELDRPRLTAVAPFAYRDFHCLQTCAQAWKAEASEASGDFADRVLWYGCDEPGGNPAAWQVCDDHLTVAESGWQRPALATATIADYTNAGAATGIPITTLVPNIKLIQTPAGPNTRPDYDQFLKKRGRQLWLYSSCFSFGCGTADTTSADFDGYPGYAIDAPANQARAMSWMAARFKASGELYYSYDQNLGATDLFYDGANGDGTLFHPGLTTGPDAIGGTHAIPLESLRLKRIRDGREDYEYMVFLRAHGRGSDVDAIVKSLYPRANSATAAKDGTGMGTLVAARKKLIALVDEVTAVPAGRMVFTSDRDGDREIFSMLADGSDVRQLTTNTVADDFAAWSPDGTRIAFTRGADVWVMNADGGAPTRLTRNVAPAQAEKPAWSPDGTKIVYVQRDAGQTASDLWVMDADGSGATGLVTYSTGGTASYDPSVSPSNVVYFSQSDGSLHAYPLAGGGGLTTVTSGATDEVVDVSPDGSRLTFSRTNAAQTAPYDVYLAAADGFGPVDLTATAAGGAAGNDFQSSFSPDGTSVAFASGTGNTGIWTIGTDGTGARALTPGTAHDTSPDWGPAV